MTPRQVRAALRGRFSDAGFTEAGSAFICQTPDLMHRVEVAAVRRLAGSIQIHHSVAPTGPAPQPVLTEELASHGHDSPYPRLWSAASVDGGLVLAQVLAIRRSFQTAQDLAHYFSDRHHPGDAMSVPHALPPSAADGGAEAGCLQCRAPAALADERSPVRGTAAGAFRTGRSSRAAPATSAAAMTPQPSCERRTPDLSPAGTCPG